MPTTTPNLATLVDDFRTDLQTRIAGADPQLPASNVNALAVVVGTGMRGLYAKIDFLSRQILPTTSEAEFLQQQGSLFTLFPKLPSVASGQGTATGTNGVIVPAGSSLGRADQTIYVTTADATIANGTAVLPIAAVTAGSAANYPAGTLRFVNPINGVNLTVTIAAPGLAGGLDAETEDEFRARVIERYQNPPQGGAANDYIAWASTVAGVTRVFPFPGWMGAGTVGVTFVLDDQVGSIIPSPQTVAAVQAAINARAPVTAVPIVFAPTPLPLDLTIHLIPDSAATRSLVTGNLQALIAREAIPGSTLIFSHIENAVFSAVGAGDAQIQSPIASPVVGPGQLLVLGTMSFV
ncbi:MAG TPA: baseplate J/gp47 family protein [Aliidongia sp.]|nr:baseplate J/gp47 family protein [Aliidongia sp.]